MKIALYCRELRFSGGRSVALGFLNALREIDMPHEFIIYAPEDPLYHDLHAPHMHPFFKEIKGGIRQMLAQNSLRLELDRDKPTALFMMGNLAYKEAPCPQAVLVHNSWILYPESPAWKSLSVRDRIYYRIRRGLQARSFLTCDAVLAQTPVVLNRLHDILDIPYEKMYLMPNSVTPSLIFSEETTASSKRISALKHSFRALCLSRFFPHKNLGILLHVADELLKLHRTDILLITTVNADQYPGAETFIRYSQLNHRNEVMLNIGEVPVCEVPSCYHAVDCMLLPTLLESFTGNYPDAMRAGVPILTSDLDFAHVVCRDAAMYVDPLDAEAIANALIQLADSKPLRGELVTAGYRRYSQLSIGWDKIARDTVALLERLAMHESLPDIKKHPWMMEWNGHGAHEDV